MERWSIKTLGDRPVLLQAAPTSIAYLSSRRTPAWLPSTRLPFERHIFRLEAAVTLVRPESDGDLHVVLQDGRGRTMISESPMASCGRAATPKRQAQMATARGHVRVCARASVTGVAFFDPYHGQTGVAPNGIELHPILAFRCLAATTPPPVPATATTPAPPTTTTPPRGSCAASYPDVCIPSPPPDLDCADIPYKGFRVLWNAPDPDPHRFDGDRDGIGCES